MFSLLPCQRYVYMDDYKEFRYSNRVNIWQSAKEMVWLIGNLQRKKKKHFRGIQRDESRNTSNTG